jgi:hypothetical protein
MSLLVLVICLWYYTIALSRKDCRNECAFNLLVFSHAKFTKMLYKWSLVEQHDLLPMAVLLTIRGKCSCLRAKSAHVVGHLPPSPAVRCVVNDLNVRRNRPQRSNFALKIRPTDNLPDSCRSRDRSCLGANGNSPYLFSAEKYPCITKYSQVWKSCRTLGAHLLTRMFDIGLAYAQFASNIRGIYQCDLFSVYSGQKFDVECEFHFAIGIVLLSTSLQSLCSELHTNVPPTHVSLPGAVLFSLSRQRPVPLGNRPMDFRGMRDLEAPP